MEADRSPLVRLGIVVSTLALAAVLVLGFKNPDELAAAAAADGSKSGAAVFRPGGAPGSTSTGTTGSGRAGSGGSGPGTTGSAGSGATGSTGTGGGGTGGTGGSQTVTGPIENTRYGPVEVQVTVSKGAIVDVQAVELPSGGRSGAISRYVAPILRDQALSAKSASIDGVSGATYTSSAYAASLQAALDQAGV